MGLLTTTCGLLADLDRFERLKALRQGLEVDTHETNYTALLVGAAALCGLIFLAVKYRRLFTQAGRRVDLNYLAHGARVAGLSRAETRDLETVADRAELPHPAAILLSPANLEVALEAADPEGTETRLRERIRAVAEKLFDTPPPDTTQDPPEPR